MEKNKKKKSYKRNYNQLISDIGIEEEVKELNNSKLSRINQPKLKENKIDNNLLNQSLIKENDKPPNLKFLKDLAIDSYLFEGVNNTFCVFKSINEQLYLIYSTEDESIIIYDLIQNKKINEIKNAHKKYITYYNHFLDKIKKRDLILSLSDIDNSIKIWDALDFNCISVLNIEGFGTLSSALIINDNNQNYIIFGKYRKIGENRKSIKIYDFKGKTIKEINDCNEGVYFMDIYFDKKSSKKYILAGHNGSVSSFDYEENKLYHRYNKKDNREHICIIINDKEDNIKLIESTHEKIRIWDFHQGNCLNVINKKNLKAICMWNKYYLFASSLDGKLYLYSLKTREIVNKIEEKNLVAIKKIIHPQYGECLISQGWDKDKIKIWILNNNL